MKWILLFVLLLVSFGIFSSQSVYVVFHLGPVKFYGNDIVFIAAALYAIFEYGFTKHRRPLFFPRPSKSPASLMAAYILIVVMMILRDFQANSEGFGSLIFFIRVLPFYALFFIFPAFIASRSDLDRFIKTVTLVCMIGNGIIIAQSLHGPGSMFGSGFLSEIIVAPGPQIVFNYGNFYRSNFPVYFACVWCFFYYLTLLVSKFSLSRFILVLFFSFSFILNLSRGLYFGIALAVMVFVLLIFRQGKTGLKIAAFLPLLAGIIIYAAPILGFGGLSQQVVGRISEGLTEYQGTSGNWGGRLAQLDEYLRLPKDDALSLLLGYGYTGAQSGLTLKFIEFGIIDPVYRSGYVGAAILVFVIFSILALAFRMAKKNPGSLSMAIAIALICSLFSEIGVLVSANHFYYNYYPPVIAMGTVLLMVVKKMNAPNVVTGKDTFPDLIAQQQSLKLKR